MNTYESLLARIAADPTNDEPRLVCSDFLRATDDARAELIQAQIALTGRLDPARRGDFQRRVAALLEAHGDRWLKPLRDAQAHDARFTRGFVEETRLSEEQLARHGQALLTREPVHRLHVETRDGKGLALAAGQPWFEQVRYLRLEGGAVEQATRALAAAPHASKLRGLTLAGVDDEALRAVAGSPGLGGLRSLCVASSELSDDTAEALAKGKLALERLYLSGTGLSDEGAQALARGKGLATLQLLALNRNALSDEGAQALARSKTLLELTRLELSKNELSEEGALEFRSAKALPKLRRLELLDMDLDQRELEPLRKRLGAGLRL
ncbi:TIGR02996 domain-containing protein [Pyxidicoccus fallax]|uniref:TIGR02996 domain-containing protein n=1 Tax=Pyxidicoccus fallax TaxID=394095 RepID=A0A848M0I6_9BACT|nr:TIGR02996 domain-containing protein [Pyxidicoccus fallax]NMO23053.1 TIGR02996 domain-containing protein [Pyxidicoccus fallax]NPC86428.1 TIGR02996 domain-containing protein [Pyxidicoccus fallax]